METSKILTYGAAALVVTGILATSSYAAFGEGKKPRIDFDSAPVEVQTILTQAQEEGRETVTDEQKEVLKAYHETQKDAQLAQLPDDIRTLVEKAHEEGRDSLTDQEQEILKQYRDENRPEGFEGRGGKRRGHIGPRTDFDSAPAEVQAIITQAKEEGRVSITDEQKEVLKTYHEAQREARLAELPDNIRTLIEKAHDEGRESLTIEERETLKQHHLENDAGRGGKR